MLDGCILAFLAFVTPQYDVRDIGFQYAVEQFVGESSPRFKPPVQAIIDQAGDDEWCCRDAASRRLRRVDPRWLFHGLQSRDMEIRQRCNTALRSMTICNGCYGSGLCRFMALSGSDWRCGFCGKARYSHGSNRDDMYNVPCVKCDALGSSWSHTAWDLPRWKK